MRPSRRRRVWWTWIVGVVLTASAALAQLIPPSAIQVTNLGATSLKIDWTHGATTSKYLVERSTDDITYTRIATVAASTYTYTDTTVSEGVPYYYRIEEYPYSPTGTGTPAAATTTTATTTTVVTTSTTTTTLAGSPWDHEYGSPGDDRGFAVATDANGNVFATGQFTGTVNFGTGALTSSHFDWLNANDYKDIFLIKLTSAGTATWVKQFGVESNDAGIAVAADTDGVALAGEVANTVNLGCGSTGAGAGNYDLFVAKYANSDGACRWSKRFGSSSSDYGYGVAMDASGNVFATGVYYDTVNFGGSALTTYGGADAFLVKYGSATGTHLWSKHFGGTASDVGWAVATDASGNVFLAARFSGTANFGGASLTSLGGTDTVLAKYSGGDGSLLWQRQLGGTLGDYGQGLAVDASGNVYLAGYFSGTATFGGASLVSAGADDIVLARYAAADGAHVWSKRLGSTGSDEANDLTIAGSNLIVTGYFSSTVDFGTSNTLTSTGSIETFVARYSQATGAYVGAKKFGSTVVDYGQQVAADASGNALVSGSFGGTGNFGSGPHVSAGGNDIFLLKAAP